MVIGEGLKNSETKSNKDGRGCERALRGVLGASRGFGGSHRGLFKEGVIS